MNRLKNSVLLFAPKNATVSQTVRDALEERGVAFELTTNIQKAFDYLSEEEPCLALIDLPADDPRLAEFCRKVKKIKEEIHFEIYSLIDDNKNFEEQWNGFKLGVDEFGTRDTNVNLIVERVLKIIKPFTPKVAEKGLVIDKERYVVFVDGREIYLPRKEFELLILLASKPNKVFTRKEIFFLVWGNRLVVGDRTIDVHIRKIREKIGEDCIVTVKGVGYKYVEN